MVEDRYGSKEMKALWSEEKKRKIWRQIWSEIAEVQFEAGLLTLSETHDICSHAGDIDIERAMEIEEAVRHDLVAELQLFAEQCEVGGSKIHLGCTSEDIKDNCDSIRVIESLDIVRLKLKKLLKLFAEKIRKYSDVKTMAFTHLQPATVTTVSYRLASYAQDLLLDYRDVDVMHAKLRVKGFTGAVGTSASHKDLLKNSPMNANEFSKKVCSRLGVVPSLITTQVNSQRQELKVTDTLSRLAASISRFALDFRLLSSPLSGEVGEFFSKDQIGSSALPHKKNPVLCETICGLARLISSMPQVLWGNHANCSLERTLDSSSNRRFVLPQIFILIDEILERAISVVGSYEVDKKVCADFVEKYESYVATERLLTAAVKAGSPRAEVYKILDKCLHNSLGNDYPSLEKFRDMLIMDSRINKWIPLEDGAQFLRSFGPDTYLGDAREKSLSLAGELERIQ